MQLSAKLLASNARPHFERVCFEQVRLLNLEQSNRHLCVCVRIGDLCFQFFLLLHCAGLVIVATKRKGHLYPESFGDRWWNES